MKTPVTVLLALFLIACQQNSSEWENLDYAKIVKENYQRENDANYTPPTISNCVDDDLYNCPPKGNYR